MMVQLLAWTRLAFYASLIWSTAASASAPDSAVTQWPLHSDGLNQVVQWDHYSFLVNGKRGFIFAGDWHYWRLPVPEMWEDILQKIKAAGFNAFTFYGHWGFHAPQPDVIDFSNGARNITKLFELAHSVGLYVFVRPGPYINAEASAGGFPLWLTTGEYGALRDNDTRYTAAWEPYQTKFAELTAPHQVTAGGNALAYQIENEYGNQFLNLSANKAGNDTAIDYMELLENNARKNGINIPLTHNNPNMNSKSWSKDFTVDGGDVDMYGIDSYPACWSCNLAECTIYTNGIYVAYGVQEYYTNFQTVAPTQPEFMPEFQGGSYNPWGGPKGGCIENSNQDFANLFYRHNIAQRVTAMSLYMIYGGTNWGWVAAPVTATSYDYSAPISEDRSIGAKYYETKNLALFTRVAEDLAVTELKGNGTQYTGNKMISTTELRNPSTNAAFYITIHTNSSLGTTESFKLKVSTSLGNFTVPQKGGHIVLDGHQSKIVVTDFVIGSETLVYSTAEVLTYAIFDGKPTLVLWVPTGESGEFYIKGAKSGKVASCKGCSNTGFHADSKGLLATFTQGKGMSVMQIGNTRVLVLDRTTAYPFWAPTLSTDPLVSPNDTVLVQGPYLVRGASLSGSTVKLIGDSIDSTTVEVFAPTSIKKISWNGKALNTKMTAYGSLTASLKAVAENTFTPPSLGPWKVADSLPEIKTTYKASSHAWIPANHTKTANPAPPETLPVLYIDDYGFHSGATIFRGIFTSSASSVFLSIQGGTAFGWSAWLNGGFIGSWYGNSTQFSQQGNLTLSFHNATVHTAGKENILTILMDNAGHDETSGALNPRGIINATLIGHASPKFTSWKIAGTAGGDTTMLDPLRGALNEGGMAAERLGWHLPGFNDSKWAAGSPSTGFTGAGVKFYRTVVPLSVPAGLDVSLAFDLSTPKGSTNTYRALLFVNGYQYGRFNPWIGHQEIFPVPTGILNTNGENTIGLAVWSQSVHGAKVDVKLKAQYMAETGYDFGFNAEYLRPGWTEAREVYG
jgi:beta-galactosidase GanA